MYAKGKKEEKKRAKKVEKKGDRKASFLSLFLFSISFAFFSLSLFAPSDSLTMFDSPYFTFLFLSENPHNFFSFIPHAPLAVSYHQSPFRVPSLFSFGSIEMEEKGRERKRKKSLREEDFSFPLWFFPFFLLSLHLWSFFSPSEKGVGIRTLEM